MTATECTGYLAATGFDAQLLAELKQGGHDQAKILAKYGRLVLASGGELQHFWSQNVWYEPELINIQSISDAAKQLKQRQRNWWPYAFHLHRRTELIQERLPKQKFVPQRFPSASAQTPLGSYLLIDNTTLLLARHCRSTYPNGELQFEEYKEGPPSRAYLKLWEALTLANRWPKPGERCLELGASPGGWTWVLTRLGAEVVAVDRAPLAEHIASLPGVSFVKGDAFASKPTAFGRLDWLFSDVICYPEKLYEFVRQWLDAGLCANFICTIKFQGDTHYEWATRFAALPGSQVLHLSHNKHELTWIRCSPD